MHESRPEVDNDNHQGHKIKTDVFLIAAYITIDSHYIIRRIKKPKYIYTLIATHAEAKIKPDPRTVRQFNQCVYVYECGCILDNAHANICCACHRQKNLTE